MNTSQYSNLDIDAKLPIILVDSIEDESIKLEPLNLPKPSFRVANNATYKARKKLLGELRRKKSCYYHYDEPTPEQLLTMTEYDMDEEDTAWLKKFNEKNKCHISEDDFEKIMDRLEKESYFESKQSENDSSLQVDEDAVCAICADGDCANSNVILFCDMCNLAVHQECYGVPYIPEGQWLCRRCLQSPSRNVECVLCPNKGGAFKQTSDNRWCHVICALWIPEVCFANTVFLEPIDNIDQIPQARLKLQCYICKQKKRGACIQCHKSSCYVPFHVTCAQQAGLSMKIQTHRYDTPEGPLTDVIKKAFCDQHGPTAKGSDRSGMYSGDDDSETDVDDPKYLKWKKARKEKMRKTRKILAEKRQSAPNPISEPCVEPEKLLEISDLLPISPSRSKKKKSGGTKGLTEQQRELFIRMISGYWLIKRKRRNGVPLLRRLQVSYNNAIALKNRVSLDELPDCQFYEALRYDLEKLRMLFGLIGKRETFKSRLFSTNKQLIERYFDDIDFNRKKLEKESDKRKTTTTSTTNIDEDPKTQ